MKRYFLRRFLYTFPTLFGVSLVLFFIFNGIGGDPAYQLAGKNASLEQIENLRQQLGTHQSLLHQYKDFLWQTVTLDWGQSWYFKENINSMLLKGLGPSLALTVPSFFFTLLLALSVALSFSYFRSEKSHSLLTWFCLSLMSVSFLTFIIVFQYLFAFKWGLFPINGWSQDFPFVLSFLLLPWFISIIVSVGPDILIYRTLFQEEINKDYVKTAQAKGLLTTQILYKHILKNSMLPILSLLLSRIPQLLLGSLLLESFFGIPGLGGIMIQALQNADFPMVKAITMMSSLVYILLNLLADLLFLLFDPRVELK